MIPWKVIVPCGCITVVLVVALIKGIDGALLASGLSILAGIGGFGVGRVFKP